MICAWDATATIKSSPQAPAENSASSPRHQTSPKLGKSSRYRKHVQAHTHWINDLALAQSQTALVSASSDTSVKVWRPYAEDISPPQTIGLHTDYVKRVTSPGDHADWVASGGLDHQVFLWDLNGAGQRLQINAASEESPAKGSVYALAANETMIAAGGPESIVKLWDVRSGKPITKFIGHTDMVRDFLISQDNDRIMSASSDGTVKVWSMRAARCMHTLVMHTESVWTLKAGDPSLSIFYSGDRSGFLAKTDTRHVADMDEGSSIAICREHEGIMKIATVGNTIWTATQSSSLSCWEDVDMSVGIQFPEELRGYRVHGHSASRSWASTTTSPPRGPSSPEADSSGKIPFTCLLRTSNRVAIPSARAYSAVVTRKNSVLTSGDSAGFSPLRRLPNDTIEGQDGLKTHVLLNDKQRVLTQDTTGNVMLWDLLQVRCHFSL